MFIQIVYLFKKIEILILIFVLDSTTHISVFFIMYDSKCLHVYVG